jgi:hypothetical protein
MLFFESQNTLLWVGLSVTAGAFIVQLLLCISRARLCVKLIPLYFLGIYALFILLVLTGFIWDDTNFYISAQQLIAVILVVIGAFAGVGMAIAWALYGLLRRKPQ